MLKNHPLDIYVFINITDFQSRKEHLQMILYRPILRMASGIVFGCRKQQQEWGARYALPRDKSSIIYNGVDCSFFSPDALDATPSELRIKFGFSREDVVIVNVAEFRPEKAQEDLIRACEVLHRKGYPVQLVLVGDGPRRKTAEQLVRNLGIGNIVHFRGRTGDVRPDLSIADIFALPSRAVETFSNAALEAMAMGKPVVISDIGGASEMVWEGENGYLFPPSNGAELVKKLEGLVKDSAARKEMGARGRELVRERFAFGTMLEQYERLLQSPVCRQANAVNSERGDYP
jgi:glycosyltransferase involved in cell wall biosynthesis